jgi:hypothetical protein
MPIHLLKRADIGDYSLLIEIMGQIVECSKQCENVHARLVSGPIAGTCLIRYAEEEIR